MNTFQQLITNNVNVILIALKNIQLEDKCLNDWYILS